MDELNEVTYQDLLFIAKIISLLIRQEVIWNIFSEEDDDRGLIVRLELRRA